MITNRYITLWVFFALDDPWVHTTFLSAPSPLIDQARVKCTQAVIPRGRQVQKTPIALYINFNYGKSWPSLKIILGYKASNMYTHWQIGVKLHGLIKEEPNYLPFIACHAVLLLYWYCSCNNFRAGYLDFYAMSYMWYSAFAVSIVIIVGLTVSFITGKNLHIYGF